MTNEEAIEAIKCNWPDSRYTILREALDMAISALRQQETAANRNDPLTLDELREMPCESVYIVAGYVSWWDIVSYAGREYLYLKVEGSLPFRDYGKNWTAYRQKPEEGTD